MEKGFYLFQVSSCRSLSTLFPLAIPRRHSHHHSPSFFPLTSTPRSPSFIHVRIEGREMEECRAVESCHFSLFHQKSIETFLPLPIPLGSHPLFCFSTPFHRDFLLLFAAWSPIRWRLTGVYVCVTACERCYSACIPMGVDCFSSCACLSSLPLLPSSH